MSLKGIRKSGTSAEKQFEKYYTRLVIMFSLTVLVSIAFLTVFILLRSESAMRSNVSRLVAANSEQLEININSYLEKMETTATLLFADEDYYKYDETDDSIDEYEKIKIEEAIMNRIVDLGMMYNFSDFYIVYADGHKVGWNSKVTAALFVDANMYETFSAYAVNQNTQDGWCWGIQGNVDRIYYVKRLNPNALLVSSIYNKELDRVFEHPEELEALAIRLVNEDNQIMFSSDKEEIGENLAPELLKMIEGYDNVSTMNSQYLVTANQCENGWKVVCSIPSAVVLKENENLKGIAIMFAVVLTCLVVLLDLSMLKLVSQGVDGVVNNLAKKASYDQLSGMLNKNSFQELTRIAMGQRNAKKANLFIMLDMDNFKQINDQAGHSTGDEVIRRIGQVLKDSLGEKALIGRIGGDEFSVYLEMEAAMGDKRMVRINREMNHLLDDFAEEFAEEEKLYGTSVSLGVYILDKEDEEFEEAYSKADVALYHSKRNGKKQYTIYQEGMKLEQE